MKWKELINSEIKVDISKKIILLAGEYGAGKSTMCAFTSQKPCYIISMDIGGYDAPSIRKFEKENSIYIDRTFEKNTNMDDFVDKLQVLSANKCYGANTLVIDSASRIVANLNKNMVDTKMNSKEGKGLGIAVNSQPIVKGWGRNDHVSLSHMVAYVFNTIVSIDVKNIILTCHVNVVEEEEEGVFFIKGQQVIKKIKIKKNVLNIPGGKASNSIFGNAEIILLVNDNNGNRKVQICKDNHNTWIRSRILGELFPEKTFVAANLDKIYNYVSK